MQVLRVLPNPWAAVDKDGHPCGVCPRDTEADGGGPGLFVGARPDSKKTKVLQDFGRGPFGDNAAHEIRSARQSTKYSYLGISSDDPRLADQLGAKDAIEVPATKYYKDRLLEGSLIPADIETARKVRVPFVEPAGFYAARAKAIEPKPAEEAQATAPEEEPLPETPGLVPLPDSPDAAGNLVEAPALPDGETREGVELPADGVMRGVDFSTSPPTIDPPIEQPAETGSLSSTKKPKKSEA